MKREALIEGIWERDATTWTGRDEAHWLGWLDEPLHIEEQLGEIRRFAESLHDEVDDVVLCGMGGSSLAPEVLRRSFEVDWFHVLDTTHPKAIRALEEKLDLERTLFVSSSKSGSTLETRSHTDYFWEKTGKRGALFCAVTDPGSELERLARERGFRAVFAGEPSIGGRYSALSPFGIVPAVLMGVDGARLLERAQEMRDACRSDEGNPGYELGSRLGTGWQEGRDKICISDAPGDFGLWAEQLIAESTGKHGKGLIPAPGESPDGPDRQAAQPELPDPYALGAEFFRWEFAIAVAGAYLEINPFDQPDVQAAKDKTNEVLGDREGAQARTGGLDRGAARAGAGGRLRLRAGVHRADRRERPPHRGSRGPASPRERPRGHARLRPALPALHGPAAQGRPEHRSLPAADRRRGRRAADSRQAVRVPAADPRAGGGRPRDAEGARPAGRAE